MSVCFIYIRFHKGMSVQGIERNGLPFASRLNKGAAAAWYGIVMITIILFFSGWSGEFTITHLSRNNCLILTWQYSLLEDGAPLTSLPTSSLSGSSPVSGSVTNSLARPSGSDRKRWTLSRVWQRSRLSHTMSLPHAMLSRRSGSGLCR